MHFLHQLEDQDQLLFKHISGQDINADIFTKNTRVRAKQHDPKLGVGGC